MNTSITKLNLRKSPLLLGAVVTAGVLACAAASRAQTAPGKLTFNSFPKVQNRNIFDPDRSRDYVPPTPGATRIRPTESSTRPTPPPPPRNTDYVQLTGIMTTEDETFAFFAGTQPEYNKVVPVNNPIAGATITKITTTSIDVVRDGKSVTVNVGQTVPLDKDSAPGLPPSSTTSVAPITPVVPVAPATQTTTTTPGTPLDPHTASDQVPLPETGGTAAPTSAAPDDNMSDAMKRMMERRQQELNK